MLDKTQKPKKAMPRKPPHPDEGSAVTLFLRKQRAHDIIEGLTPQEWPDDDYAVIDGRSIGRIYRTRLPGGEKWCWFLQGPHAMIPAGIVSSGHADTLDQAKAELAEQYRRACDIP
jgi:hypothetical protein